MVLWEEMQVEIASFTIRSYDEVLALWRQTEGVGLHDDSDSRPAIRSYLARNRGMSFVARAGGVVVGAVLSGHDGRRGYIHHLAVRPDHRRIGIGRRLVESCLEVLSAAGITKVHIFILGGNTAGTAFWNALGWMPRRDIGVMSKRIEPDGAGDGVREGGRGER